MNSFPEIDGLLTAPTICGGMRYQWKGGEWASVTPSDATLYRLFDRKKGIGGVVETLTHDGTPGGIEAAVRLLLRFAY